MSKYPISEYSHPRKQSMAAALIRAQGEQLRETPAEEYLIDKIGSGEHDKSSEIFNTDFLDT
ncbi:hypothetical protein [Clostridium sp. Marseille-P3244]|uniref:hypothetical protein n=1 Tax=Clostridium sp. Marseille-P3244 TaxID=1871020 RepID=UPI000931375C|nr:hypothetical protein [Clostridium sp. Marseille-P3244]